MTDTLPVRLEADTTPLQSALKDMEKLAERFGAQMTGALKGAVVSGKELDDVLRQLATNLASMALDQGLKPLQGVISSAFSALAGSITPFASGGVPGRVTAFADGGVVAAPTFFPMGSGLGLMGEAGSEAILPLKRGSDGSLGVAAPGGSGGAVNVTFNVQASDAASFRKSEAQMTAMLARAVSRGARHL
ncbi:MAG: phage tail protein [Phyllobacteriaceae bacterium]|nr:phage tail protein [Phyllobacteriaceae bacterium]MBA89277.1 phage tail protein [Phyllobacteriaceae bacterium]